MSSPNHVVFITGANTGIGLETVRALAKSSTPYTIILGGRTPSKVDEAIKQVQSDCKDTESTFDNVQIDVTDDESIKAAFDTVSSKYDHIDTLINNAGAAFDNELWDGKISMRQAWNQAWDVNVTGAQIVTYTFASLLVKTAGQARLLFLTSGTASIIETDPEKGWAHLTKAPSKGWPKNLGFDVSAYRSSKVGLNMMMRQWERIFREDGVKVFSISPGFLATGLGGAGPERLRSMGAGEPHLGGEFIRDVIEGKRDDHAGLAIRSDKIQDW